MNLKEFFGKFVSRYLLWNLAAMVFVVIALCIGVMIGLSKYTHHGESVEVPDMYGQDFDEMEARLAEQNLYIIASDTGYNKKLDAGAILMQTPGAGSKVKAGRTIYVTINSTNTPSVAIPDIIDNSSFREAQARLTAVGFLLLEPQRVSGERDWVYGVKLGSRNLQAGDMVPVESALTLVIGSGSMEEDRNDAMLDVPTDNMSDEIDDFEVVE